MVAENVVREAPSAVSAEKSSSGWQRCPWSRWLSTGICELTVYSSQKFAMSDCGEVRQA